MKNQFTKIFFAIWIILTTSVTVGFLSVKSSNPFIFNRYSIAYFIFIVTWLLCVTYFWILILKFGKEGLWIFGSTIAITTIGFLLIESSVHLYAWIYPGYKPYGYQLDEHLGWKPVPNAKYLFTGYKLPWYEKEFTTEVCYDDYGFHNRTSRPFEKPPLHKRIGIYGDSFIEGREVPVEFTSASLAERTLNDSSAGTYEVFNFGISSHGVGQNYLSWKYFGFKYDLDLVFILINHLTLNRTVTTDDSIFVRPTFSLVHDSLHLQTNDYQKAIGIYKTINQRIQNDLDGLRYERMEHSFFLKEVFNRIKTALGQLQITDTTIQSKVSAETLKINLAVLKQFDKEVKKENGRFIIVDACEVFHSADSSVSDSIKKFCEINNIEYLPVSTTFIEAKKNGIQWSWPYDGHFNKEGHRIFASTITGFIK